MNTLLPGDRGYKQDPQYRELPKDIGGYQHIENGLSEDGDIWVNCGIPVAFVQREKIGCDIGVISRNEYCNIYRKIPQPCNHQPDVEAILASAGPLPEDHQKRKAIPIATGFIDYFPRAVAAVAHISHVGNEQHNPGTPLHWDRSKSGDHADCLMRHFVQRGTLDSDGCGHTAKLAWRAMALLEVELENAAKCKT